MAQHSLSSSLIARAKSCLSYQAPPKIVKKQHGTSNHYRKKEGILTQSSKRNTASSAFLMTLSGKFQVGLRRCVLVRMP